jgi:hypothetical protein
MISDYDKKGESLSSRYKQAESDYNQKVQEYTNYQNEIKKKTQEIETFEEHYREQQSKLEGLGRDVESSVRKLAKKQQVTGLAMLAGSILGGNLLGVGLKALGAPTWLSTGAKMGIKFGGGLGSLQYMGNKKHLGTKLSDIPEMNYNSDLKGMSENIQRGIYDKGIYDISSKYTPISYGTLGNPRHVNIPQLGGLPLAVEHFNMPTIPEMTKLPKLNQALGRLVSAEDLNKLTLGLPSNTLKSGKQFNSAVYLNPDYLKQLKKITKGFGYKPNQIKSVA